MDRSECGEFLAVYKSCYPRDNMFHIPKVVDVWFKQLEDLNYGIAMAALNKWIATEKWAPTIADIRSMYVDIVNGNDTADWSKAWEQVNKVISKYGYYRPDDAYKELGEVNEIAVETVRRIGYGKLCMSENQTADRANFRDIYCELTKRAKQDAQIPKQLRLVIDKMQNLRISGDEQKKLEG